MRLWGARPRRSKSHAVQRSQLETVEMLLKNGADFSVVDEDGWTVLHQAAFMGQLEIVRVPLMDIDEVDILAYTNRGETAEDLARKDETLERDFPRYDRIYATAYLAWVHADSGHDRGETAAYLAQLNAYDEIVRLLAPSCGV